jgi:hypothetical protein
MAGYVIQYRAEFTAQAYVEADDLEADTLDAATAAAERVATDDAWRRIQVDADLVNLTMTSVKASKF